MSGMLLSAPVQSPADMIRAAEGVVERTFPEVAERVHFAALQSDDGQATYIYEASDNTLTVKASDAVTMCRGFYDYMREHGDSIYAWSGRRLGIHAELPDAPLTQGGSPYRLRLRDNVCAFGYTSPYWGWDRWQQELDWMALHGFNMQIAPAATEAIWDRVWWKFGLTQDDLDRFFTGPAFLPWHRMGNVNIHSGPLTSDWHKGQIALQKQILARMRELGMEPIAPAFAGFIPRSLERVQAGIKTYDIAPWAGFSSGYRTTILDPLSPLYKEIGKAYITEWEREFGDAKYFIADSFNELEVPVPEDRAGRLKTLAQYGRAVYDSIAAGDPEGVWVMQGWLFSFMPDFWDKESAAALLQDIPDDRLLMLDLCQEQYRGWREQNFYRGKQWLASYIPTWGGNNLPAGDLEFYAQDPAHVLAETKQAPPIGFGVSGEGFESNEVLYELLSDAAWSSESINPEAWIPAYCESRYGSCPPAMAEAWQKLMASSYGQHSPGLRSAYMLRPRDLSFDALISSFPANADYAEGVRLFLSCRSELGDEPLYVQDAIELAAPLLAHYGELRMSRGMTARVAGSNDAGIIEQEALNLWLVMDALLDQHPVYRLESWIDHARAWGTSEQEKDRYEVDAKRIVTTWGGFLTEYAAKMWSGLIRDYYVPRWRVWIDHRSEFGYQITPWEERWISSTGLSDPMPIGDPLDEIERWLRVGERWSQEPAEWKQKTIWQWTPELCSMEWQTIEVPIQLDSESISLLFAYQSGGCRLDIRRVALVVDGEEISVDEHLGHTGHANVERIYRLTAPKGRIGASATLRISYRSDGGTDSNGNLYQLARAQ